MALPTKPQYPVNGKYKKDFKVTSDFGYRIHPITKAKKHHNGTDLWGSKEPLLIEAFYDGVVIAKSFSATGFGNYVVIRHIIDGKKYTSMYAHMKAASKLKVRQKVEAGTVVGIMGTTGASTGKHLHFEIGKGATHPFISGGDGKRYVEPMKFIATLIKKWEGEKELADAHIEANQATPADSIAQPMPTHSIPASDLPKVSTPAPAPKPAPAKKPAPKK